jgi:3-oxoacyl-[acyl-carrier protein] reductase
MDLQLKGARVCISGGTKGMGRLAALAFAREGARVVIVARDPSSIERTVAELQEAGAAEAFGVRADVSNLAEIEDLFAQIASRWGQLNTLINMAGPTRPPGGRDFLEIPDAAWQFYFDVGIMSVVRCTRAAVPLMRKAGWGRVINISSIMSRIAGPGEAPYMAAKSGLNALSKNLAWTLAPEGILVNTVTPGAVHTEALRNYMIDSGVSQRYDVSDLAQVASYLDDMYGGRVTGVIGRVAAGDEVSSLLLLLGSPANSYIVGANIPIDGGTDFSPG